MPANPAFTCPQCHAPLEQTSATQLFCVADGYVFPYIDGIWRFLLPERVEVFSRFIREYETIRQAEGRGSHTEAYYQSLPYQDLNGNMFADWQIRAASFDMLLQKVIAPLEQTSQPLTILDLGAGNGWLSNRLAQRGHMLTAVDLVTNDFDGLACRRYYQSDFTPLQAEFDWLPFPAGFADLVVFNASLHYSVNLKKTLAEALRVLSNSGTLVVMDSPVYREAASGEKMVQEREKHFTQRFGFPSNALPSQNFLTYPLLQTLATGLDLDWQFLTPFYGLAWLLKPFKASLLRRREPAKFHLILGRKQPYKVK